MVPVDTSIKLSERPDPASRDLQLQRRTEPQAAYLCSGYSAETPSAESVRPAWQEPGVWELLGPLRSS